MAVRAIEVDPGQRTLDRGHVAVGQALVLELEDRPVPGLADDGAILLEGRLRVGRALPPVDDLRLVGDHVLRRLAVAEVEGRLLVIGLLHRAGGQLAVTFHPQAGAQHARALAAEHQALVLGLPEIAERGLAIFERGLPGVPGQGLRAPVIGQRVPLAVARGAQQLGVLDHAREDVGHARGLALVERGQVAVVDMGRDPGDRRRGEVPARATTGRLQLVQAVLVGGIGGDVESDAGVGLEAVDQRLGRIVFPGEPIDLAGRRERLPRRRAAPARRPHRARWRPSGSSAGWPVPPVRWQAHRAAPASD